MTVNDSLALRRTERQLLLEKALELLQADSRVKAAWLVGSMGRGTHDALSDIDLQIISAEGYTEELNAERMEYACRIGEPLLSVEAPQNAPPGGAYLLLMYEGSIEAGPQFLDLRWQPESGAPVPQDARVLFNRARSRTKSSEAYDPPEKSAPTARSQTVFFWMMVPFAAKYIARKNTDKAAKMLQLLRDTLMQVRALAGLAPLEDWSNEPHGPSAQLDELGDLAHAMESMSRDTELEGYVSYSALVQVRAAFDLAAGMLDAQP